MTSIWRVEVSALSSSKRAASTTNARRSTASHSIKSTKSTKRRKRNARKARVATRKERAKRTKFSNIRRRATKRSTSLARNNANQGNTKAVATVAITEVLVPAKEAAWEDSFVWVFAAAVACPSASSAT